MQTRELRLFVGNPPEEFTFRFVPPGNATIGLTKDQRTMLASKDGNVLVGQNATSMLDLEFSEGFFILDREITVAQYRAVMDATRRSQSTTSNADGHDEDAAPTGDSPCSSVTWNQARDFCEILGDHTGFCIRLPTECEWEYAARGPDGNLFAMTNDPPTPYRKGAGDIFCAVIRGADGAGALPLTGIRSQDRSWCNVFDLSGNLSEWCLDKYDLALVMPNHSNKVRPSLLRDNVPPSAIESRTLRGANFADSSVHSALALRRSFRQDKGNERIGFRPTLVIKLDKPNIFNTVLCVFATPQP